MLLAAPTQRRHASRVPTARGLHRRAVLAAVVGVLLVHFWLLSRMPVPDTAGVTPDAPALVVLALPRPPAALQNHTLALPEATPALPRAEGANETAAAVARARPPGTQAAGKPQPAASMAPIERAVAPQPFETAAAVGPPARATPAAVPVPSSEGAEVPTYDTRPAPAARLSYALQRGSAGAVAEGHGELVWTPVDAGYTLSLQASAAGAALFGGVSRGGFDAAGIAPERHVDSRRGRDAQATNFRRDSARITFSGPAAELPLAPGTQDRLTWMLQLPAIVDAGPARFGPGEAITMWVVGARGDAGVWTFVVDARETVEVPAGSVEGALRLTREPRGPYDTRVEVWLDPARHHLPVKLRMSIPQAGHLTELALHDARFP